MNSHASSAAELAWHLEQLCLWGITLREMGRCAGELLNPRLRRTHTRAGHDPGCFALGLPIPLVEAKLTELDTRDAQRFIFEPFSEAIREISAEAAQFSSWRAESARETILYAIHRRITPRAPAVSSTEPPATKLRRRQRPRLLLQPRPPPLDHALSSLDVSTRGSQRSRQSRGAASPE